VTTSASTTTSRSSSVLAAPSPRRDLNKTSWEYLAKSGFAGGLAGCAGKTVVGPLDRVKILFQASNPVFAKYTGSWFGVFNAIRDIYGQDGTRGLFKGHSATLLRIAPYAGIKFLAYEQVRAWLIPTKDRETPLRRLLSGSISGCASVLFTYPLEVIRVRLAFETKRDGRSTLTSICRKIYNERPPPPQTAAPSTASPLAQAASAASTTAQHATPSYGIVNFFRGFVPTFLGMIPYAGLSFLTHDTVGDMLRHASIAHITTLPKTQGRGKDPHKPAQLKYWAELTAGGLAGFVSQAASYPLEVIRRRMQVGGVVGDGHRLGMAEVARRIWLERGWRGFFVGLSIGYVKVIPMTATSFLVYERSKYFLGI
jgi:solute carrier family 25 (mitochondrial carrier protein), member 16